MAENRAARIKFIDNDFSIDQFDNPNWLESESISIDSYWSGSVAPTERHAMSNLLWSDTALYLRFIANQFEPLNINSAPKFDSKTDALWERDVCEVFIAPDAAKREAYCEFEVSPSGEWLDLRINMGSGVRQTDWDYDSGFKSAVTAGKNEFKIALKISWDAFDSKPLEGEIWCGNLFRVVGSGDTRGYLSWRPTFTGDPDFHVPEKFGEFLFVK